MRQELFYELLDLARLRGEGARAGLLVLSPLTIVGATTSPVAPLVDF